MGIHAYAMGEGRIRREPQRGGRERCINRHPGGRYLYCILYAITVVIGNLMEMETYAYAYAMGEGGYRGSPNVDAGKMYVPTQHYNI
jgi:hypothetical protein